jgi:hypothetical protein
MFTYTCCTLKELDYFSNNIFVLRHKTYNITFHRSLNYLLLTVDELQLFPLDISKLIIDYSKDIIDITYINTSKYAGGNFLTLTHNNIEYTYLFGAYKINTDNDYLFYLFTNDEGNCIEFDNISYNDGSQNLLNFFNYYDFAFNGKQNKIKCDHSAVQYDYNTNSMIAFNTMCNESVKVVIINNEVFDIMLNIVKILVENINLYN